MMYLLTQEEFDALQEKNRKITEDAQKILQDLYNRIAKRGCVLTVEHEWYCDDYSVPDVCLLENKP